MLRRSFATLVLAVPFFTPAHAAPPVSASGAGPTAIGGHDAVSYHLPAVRQSHAALAGEARFVVLYLFYAERGRQRWLTGDWQSYRGQADAAWQAAH